MMNPTDLQHLELWVGGPRQENRLYITMGQGSVSLTAVGGETEQEYYYYRLPQLFQAGEFRRAIATVAVKQFHGQHATWTIDDVSAGLHDETAQVELRFSLRVQSHDKHTSAGIEGVSFTVMSTARK